MQQDARYLPDEDAVELSGAFAGALEALLPIARLHKTPGEPDATWAELDGLGLFAMSLAEDAGGAGLGPVEETLITIELGRGLASPGVLATIGAAPTGLLTPGGRVGAAWRTMDGIVVADPAPLMLLRDGDRITLHRGPDKLPEPLDAKHWLTSLVTIASLGEPLAELSPEQRLRVRLLDAAYLAGVARTAQDMAVAYAGMREQFGRPIGAFQAVKHRCADMAIATRRVTDQASFAAVALADGRADAELEVACAFLAAGLAAIDNAGACIQVHGGIGFSDEADPHLTLKRARLIVAIGGGLDAAIARVGDIAPRL